jgi:flagellar motor switch protein FliM
VLAKLNVQHFGGLANAKKEKNWSASILRQLGSTSVEAKAVLGETSLTLRELIGLEPGDILRTNIPMDGDVQVLIGGKTRIHGRPGVSKGKVAVRITETRNEPVSGE